MQTPKKKSAPVSKPVTYKDMRALRIAKARKKLPRGLKAEISTEKVVFRAPGQGVPVLSVGLLDYAKGCLKTDGFKLAEH